MFSSAVSFLDLVQNFWPATDSSFG